MESNLCRKIVARNTLVLYFGQGAWFKFFFEATGEIKFRNVATKHKLFIFLLEEPGAALLGGLSEV